VGDALREIARELIGSGRNRNLVMASGFPPHVYRILIWTRLDFLGRNREVVGLDEFVDFHDQTLTDFGFWVKVLV
jgi:hypothetical protein